MALTSEQVYEKLRIPSSINEFKDENLPFIEVEGNDYQARFTSFKKIVFESLVHFKNTGLGVGLMFDSCEFNKPLVLANVHAIGYDSSLNPNSQNLLFKNCIFKEEVRFEGNNTGIDRSVHFKKSTFEKGLEVQYLKVRSGSFLIDDCTINEKLDLFNIEADQDISLAKNTINSVVRLENIKCSSLTILSNNIFNEDFYIRGGSFTRGINFNNGTFKKDVRISQVQSQKEGLTIIGSLFEESVFVKYHSGQHKPDRGLNSFYFQDASFGNGIYVDGAENILSDYPFVEKIELSVSAKLKGNIFFRNLTIELLELSGYNTAANIQFDHLYLIQLKINSFNNNAGLVFSQVKAYYDVWPFHETLADQKSKSIYIKNTNFGKAQFYQVDFSSFNRVVFHNNILTDIITSLVQWFTPDQLQDSFVKQGVKTYKNSLPTKDQVRIENNRKALISSYKSIQEIYRQLKSASQKQGDVIASLEFQKHEMRYYKRIEAVQHPRKWDEYLILWSNQTNNYGQSWLKALGLFILFSFIIYLPLGFFTSEKLDYSTFVDSGSDILLNLRVMLWDNLYKWFIIMNPIHRTSDITFKDQNVFGFIHVIDFFSKLIVSYFLFQTVNAFRKFSK